MTRGQRNKNPFNIIRSSQPWKGKVPHSDSTDKKFEQFYDIDYGLRAGMVLLKNYIRNGFNTPEKIIKRFAPSVENDTDKYLFFVSTYVPITKTIKPFSEDFYLLCVAITKFESDCNYTPQNFRFIVHEFMLS